MTSLLVGSALAALVSLAVIVVGANWWSNRQFRRLGANEGLDDQLGFPPDAEGRRTTPGPHFPDETTYQPGGYADTQTGGKPVKADRST